MIFTVISICFRSKTIHWRVEWCFPHEKLTFSDERYVPGFVLILILIVHCVSFDGRRKPPRWPSGKVSTSRAADLGSMPAFTIGLFLF